MHYTVFHNVTIAIYAKTPKDAYNDLCNQLSKNEGDWWTDTYSTELDPTTQHSTSHLFPK